MVTMDLTEIIAIRAPPLAPGLALAALIVRGDNRLEARIDAYAARPGAGRRARRSSMDDFRKEMQRLAERQSRMEGQQTAAAE